MTRYEYNVVPAPARGVKVKGAKTTEARFAHALMQLMNELGREGWEYQRTDTLPCEERVGLTGRSTRFQNMLVFRRAIAPEPEAANAVRFERGERKADPGMADRSDTTRPPAPPARPAADTGADAVAQRLAIPVQSPRGRGIADPPLRPAAEAGPSPRLGSATGNGLPRRDGHDA